MFSYSGPDCVSLDRGPSNAYTFCGRIKVVMRILSIAAILLLSTGEGHGKDLVIGNIKFFALFTHAGHVVNSPNGEMISVKKGDRLAFDEYIPHGGIAPDIVDVEATLRNEGDSSEKNVQVRLAIVPKVGSVFYEGSHDLPNHKKVLESAEWFAPLALITQNIKTIPRQASITVRFRNIDIGNISRKYLALNLWPAILRFELSVDPTGVEITYKNNTVRRDLSMNMWE